MIERGTIYWVDLGEQQGSTPAKRRPVVVVSGEAFNRSRLATVVTLDKSDLSEGVAALPMVLMLEIDRGLRGSLQL